jgi:hypothetical protein
MNAPEGESTDRQDDPAAQGLPVEKIKKEKPVVKSLTEEPEDQGLEGDKPDLPPAMPPLM